MVQKRPAAAAPAGGLKRSKQDPVAKMCREVISGLSTCDVPDAVCEMLCSMVPDSLGVAEAARHDYQRSVAEMICGLLAGAETAIKEEISAAQAAVDGSATVKAGHEAEIAKAQEQLAAAEGNVNAKKLVLAEAARTFQGCKKAAKEAAEAQVLSEREVKAASAKKTALEGILKDLVGPLAEGTLTEEGEVAKTVATLLSKLKKFEITDSLIAALPAALSKPPAERSPVDTMVVGQLAEETGKLIAGLDQLAGEAGQAAELSAVEAKKAEAALEDSKAAQLAAADAFKVARDAHDDSKKTVAEAEKALKQGLADARKSAKAADQATMRLEAFQKGPLVAASSLKERQEVVEAEAPEAEAETPEGAADEAAAGKAETEGAPVAEEPAA